MSATLAPGRPIVLSNKSRRLVFPGVGKSFQPFTRSSNGSEPLPSIAIPFPHEPAHRGHSETGPLRYRDRPRIPGSQGAAPTRQFVSAGRRYLLSPHDGNLMQVLQLRDNAVSGVVARRQSVIGSCKGPRGYSTSSPAPLPA